MVTAHVLFMPDDRHRGCSEQLCSSAWVPHKDTAIPLGGPRSHSSRPDRGQAEVLHAQGPQAHFHSRVPASPTLCPRTHYFNLQGNVKAGPHVGRKDRRHTHTLINDLSVDPVIKDLKSAHPKPYLLVPCLCYCYEASFLNIRHLQCPV